MFKFNKRNQSTKHSLWQAGKRKKEKEEKSYDGELPSKPKWFDVAQHCAPEQRKFSVEVKAEERKLDKLLRDMKNSLKDFLQGGTKFTMANALNVEIGLVTNRQGALIDEIRSIAPLALAMNASTSIEGNCNDSFDKA